MDFSALTSLTGRKQISLGFLSCRRTSRGLLLNSFFGHCVSEISSKSARRRIHAAGRPSLSQLLDTETLPEKSNGRAKNQLSAQFSFQIVTNPVRVRTLRWPDPPPRSPLRPASSGGPPSCSAAARLHFRVGGAKLLFFSSGAGRRPTCTHSQLHTLQQRENE